MLQIRQINYFPNFLLMLSSAYSQVSQRAFHITLFINVWYAFLSSPMRATCPIHLIISEVGLKESIRAQNIVTLNI
jgi:hypothetical protein